MSERGSKERSRRLFYWLSLVVLLGASLRFYDLAGESLWMDEAFTWLWVHQSHGALWGVAGQWEANPPLYYSIEKVWCGLFGDSEAALRSFSAVAGTLTIPVIFMVGNVIGGGVTGLIAALLLATSPIHIAYSQEARVYALLMLAATWAVWGLLVFLRSQGGLAAWPQPTERRGRERGLAAYAIGTSIALYGHNTAVFLPILANGIALCWWLGRARLDRRFALEWLIANLVPFCLWLWWLPVLLTQTATTINVGWVDQPSLIGAIFGATRIYGNRYLAIGSPWSAFVPVVPLLGIVGVWHWRDRWPAIATLLAFIAGVPAVIWLFGLVVRPIWIERTILWPLGLGLVLAAGGTLAVRSPVARAAIVGLVLAIQGANLIAYYRLTLKPQWERAVAEIAAASEPADVIVHFPHFTNWPFAYYAAPLAIAAPQVGIYRGEKPPFNVVERTIGQGMEYVGSRGIRELAGRHARAWLIVRNRADVDPGDEVLEQLREVGTVRLFESYPPVVEVYMVTFEPARGENPVSGADAQSGEFRWQGPSIGGPRNSRSSGNTLPARTCVPKVAQRTQRLDPPPAGRGWD